MYDEVGTVVVETKKCRADLKKRGNFASFVYFLTAFYVDYSRTWTNIFWWLCSG